VLSGVRSCRLNQGQDRTADRERQSRPGVKEPGKVGVEAKRAGGQG